MDKSELFESNVTFTDSPQLPLLSQKQIHTSSLHKIRSENIFGGQKQDNPPHIVRNFLSSSILQRLSTGDATKIIWVYNQMLQMRFLRNNIYELLKSYEHLDLSQFTKETLLSYLIDIYLHKYTNERSDRLLLKNNSPEGDSFNSLRRHFVSSSPKNEERISINISFQEHFDTDECPICLCSFEEQQQIIKTPKCFHNFCETCFKNYLKFQVLAGKVLDIKCPLEGCPFIIPEQFMLPLLDQPTQEKYQKFQMDLEVISNHNKKWCIKPDCNRIVEHPVHSHSNKMVCTCGQEFCFICNNPWHEGKTCEEAIDDDYLHYERNVLVKHCPKCDWKIEKNHGCNHMQCHCGHHFCWICLADYKNGYCVNKCPKFPNGFEDIDYHILEEIDWEIRAVELEQLQWRCFDDTSSFMGILKYLFGLFCHILCFPIVMLLIFYGTIVLGFTYFPYIHFKNLVRGNAHWPLHFDLRCNNFNNTCFFIAFLPFYIFMHAIFFVVYVICQVVFCIEAHVFTNMLKYFIVLDLTSNPFAVFFHPSIFLKRNMPRHIGDELQNEDLRVQKILVVVSIFFVIVLHFVVVICLCSNILRLLM